ncbi:KAP family P-loop NTPase fold protein [Chromobacterium violaceum]
MSRIDHFDEPSIGIGSDTPQTDPSLDQFGYAPFAALIARAIVATPSPEGLVMAIHGPWGAGKSSLLNFVKHHLNEQSDENSPVVIDFNPWWFDDRAHLASQFLAQFKSSLGLETKLIRDLGDLLADYSEHIGKAIAYSTGIAWLDKVAMLLRLFKRKKKDVPELKSEIAKALKNGNRRYLIVIDDIDRLTPKEIREVFKVVKALADFPNVIYLLAFDQTVVAEALSATPGLDGEAYLEKIIQVPFMLPTVAKQKLHQKLFADLDRLIKGADVELFDQAYWGNVFAEGIAPLINKPRDIVRYANALSVTFPALRNEVNIVDFLALECLRVNLPDLYSTIRENPKWFAGASERGLQSAERKEESEFHLAWAKKLDENIREGVQGMLERIFPRLDSTGHGSGFLNEWRKLRRAASPDVFSCYFAFAIDADQLSRQAMTTFIQGLENQERTQLTLLDAANEKRRDGTSKAKDYLSFLLDFKEEIDPTRAANLLKAIGQVADHLVLKSDEVGGFFSFPSAWRIIWAVQHALSRMADDERDAQLIASFREGRSLTFLCLLTNAIVQAHEKPVEHGPSAVLTTLKPETVESLKRLAITRIREATAANMLLAVPELPAILYRWRDWGEPAESWVWAMGLMQDKLVFVRLLTAFLSEVRSVSMGDAVGRTHATLNLKNLSDFLDLEKAAEVIGQIEPDDPLDDKQQLAVSTFLRQYPSFKEGKNPDSPFALMELD